MPQSRYLQRVNIRRQDPDAVNRGLQAGEAIGKLLGNLGTAIQGAQKNALANKLMNTEDAPRAALVSPGVQPGGPQPAATDPSDDDLRKAMAESSLSGGGGTSQDLGALPDPQPSLGINPDISPTSTGTSDAASDAALANAFAAARLGGGPTVGSTIPATSAAPASIPNKIAPGVSTAGTAPHTGGTAEMELQDKMLEQQYKRAQLAKATAPVAPPDPLEIAQKRANLAKTQMEIAAKGAPKATAADKNPPAVNISSEPVTDQNQLNKHIDGIYGNGAASTLASSINEPATLPDGTPNPNAPVVTADSVTVPTGPNKKITMPIGEAQVYVKQANAIRLKQGLPAYRVPGEDQSVGATAANPYIAKTNLDVYSRAPGTWVQLPNGKVAQVPERKQQ
jgi:hypothetical protein